jgi:microcompartment protein CcmK/EutM
LRQRFGCTSANGVRAFMMLARVIGTVVATRKDPSLEGLRFMVCRPVSADGSESGATVVAVDAVGAGVGEMVMFATGSSARQTVMTQNRPCDAVIMAIVDHWEVGGEYKYQKRDDA